MTLIPHVDEFACSGHGDCAAYAPSAFTVDDIAEVTGTAADDAILAAAKACPAAAITVFDTAGAQVYP
jgi:ferredoxin